MNISNIFKALVPGIIILAFFIPNTQASAVGDALRKTVEMENFHYTTDADLFVHKGGDMDLPFNLNINIHETGGKQGDVYGKNGSLNALMNSLQDLPSEFSDMSFINLAIEYGSAYFAGSDTTYAEIKSAHISTDGAEMMKITDMLNQFIKFVSGKSFRVSQAELSESLSSSFGLDSFGLLDEEILMSTLQSNKSVTELANSFADLVDALIESGFLHDEIMDASNRRRHGLSEIHTITLGESVDRDGAELFRQAWLDLIIAVYPAMVAELADDVLMEDIDFIMDDINSFLQDAGDIELKVIVKISDGAVGEFKLFFDLIGAGIPLTISSSSLFDYSRSYSAQIPDDENNIIDLNKIVEGFVAIGSFGMSSFESGMSPVDEGAFFPEPMELTVFSDEDIAWYLEQPIEDVVDFINSICGFDEVCVRSEQDLFRSSLRQLRVQGKVSNETYRLRLREVNDHF